MNKLLERRDHRGYVRVAHDSGTIGDNWPVNLEAGDSEKAKGDRCVFASGLRLAIPALFIVLLTISVGGACLLIAWWKIAVQPGRDNVGIPISLRTFAAAILVHFLTLPVCWVIPDSMRETEIGVFLFAGFALVVATIAFMGHSTWPGRGALRFGAIALLAVNVLGIGAILLG